MNRKMRFEENTNWLCFLVLYKSIIARKVSISRYKERHIKTGTRLSDTFPPNIFKQFGNSGEGNVGVRSNYHSCLVAVKVSDCTTSNKYNRNSKFTPRSLALKGCTPIKNTITDYRSTLWIWSCRKLPYDMMLCFFRNESKCFKTAVQVFFFRKHFNVL